MYYITLFNDMLYVFIMRAKMLIIKDDLKISKPNPVLYVIKFYFITNYIIILLYNIIEINIKLKVIALILLVLVIQLFIIIVEFMSGFSS